MGKQLSAGAAKQPPLPRVTKANAEQFLGMLNDYISNGDLRLPFLPVEVAGHMNRKTMDAYLVSLMSKAIGIAS